MEINLIEQEIHLAQQTWFQLGDKNYNLKQCTQSGNAKHYLEIKDEYGNQSKDEERISQIITKEFCKR